MLDAELTTGAVVVPVMEAFTTTQAATMLGLSRPTLMMLIDSGELAHAKVGTHHRIPAQALATLRRARRAAREQAAKALAEFSNTASPDLGYIPPGPVAVTTKLPDWEERLCRTPR